MYFDTKNTFKNNHNYTPKQAKMRLAKTETIAIEHVVNQLNFFFINIVYAMFINIEVPRLVKLRCHPERNVTYYNAELKSYFLPFFIYNNNKKIKNIKT